MASSNPRNNRHSNDPEAPAIHQDEQFWQLLAGGDKSALTHLFQKYYPLLYDYGIKLCRQRELAEDAIQEVFVVIWRKRAQLPRVQSVRGYLLTSVRNHLLNHFQAPRSKQTSMEAAQPHLPEEAFSPDPEEILLKQENTLTLKRALFQAYRRIPPRLREALFLKVYAGLSYREIAPIMGVSPQVARNYVSEVYRRLHEILSASAEYDNHSRDDENPQKI